MNMEMVIEMRRLIKSILWILGIMIMVMSSTNAFAQCGDDPGDDDVDSATYFGADCGTKTASIDCTDDIDVYFFDIPADAEYTFTSTAIYDTVLSVGSGTNWVNQGTNTMTRTYTSGTRVFVMVEPDTAGQTFEYDLEITGCDGGTCGNDPGNDTLADATPLSGCGSTPAAIDCAGDIDYYWLTAPNSGSFTFETTGDTDTELRLYNSNGDSIATDDDSGTGHNAQIVYTLTSGQKYSVAVNEYAYDDTGDYTLVVSGCSSCGDDPGDDDVGSATYFGADCGTKTASIDCTDDVDVYFFDVPADAEYTFTSTAIYDTVLSVGSGTNWVNQGTNTMTRTYTSGTRVFVMVEPDTAGQIFEYDLEITGCDGGTCGNDPGNDNLADATPLSGCGSTPAAIDCAGDIDYYWLTAPNSGSFTFETTGDTDTELRLYNANGDSIATDDDSGAGDNAQIVYTLTSGQKYSVAVNEYNYDDTGDYTLVISGCTGCGNDPDNDNLADATPLSGCGSTAAAIDCTSDLDYYWLNAPNSGSFTFETTGSVDTELRLYDSNGDAIATDDDSGSGYNARIVYTLVGGQKYSVAVNEHGYDATGSYTLEISGCTGGGCGNDPGNDDTAHATDLGSSCGTTSAAIDCASDLDYYRFTAPNSGAFHFASPTWVYLYILDSAGSILIQGTNDIQWDLNDGDVYFFQVAPVSTNDAPLDYTMTISGCSGGCGNDPGNNTLADATALSGCGSTPAAIDCVGDLDYYWLTAPNSGSFTFETTGSVDTELRLYDSNGDAIATDDDSGSGLNARIVFTLVGGQKYSVAVNEHGYDATGSYTLEISGCTGGGCGNDPGNDNLADATPLSGCGSTPASIDCIGDLDYYWLTAPNSGSFTFETTGSTDTELRLYDSNGDSIATDDDSGTDTNARIVFTLVSGQKYSVAVNEYSNDNTGDYTLVISGCTGGGCGNDPGNDDFASATTVQGCGTTSAAVDCAGDFDYYSFTATSDGTYTWTLDPANSSGLILYASDEVTEIASGVPSSTSLTAGDLVYIVVYAANPGETFNYTMTTSGCSGGGCGNDPGNDNLADATPLSGCGSTPAAFDCVGDLDYYWLTAPNSGSFTFETTGSLDTELRLYDANGDSIATDDDSGTDANARIVYTLVGGQKYSVAVNEYNNDDTGDYTLVISGCGQTGCGNDPGNDNLADATALSGCGSTAAAIDCAGDLDYYWLTAPNSGSFTFETTGSLDTELSLYDANGGSIATDDDSGTDSNARIVFTLVGGQKYSVAVNEFNNDDTGDYTLVISGCGQASCGNDPGDDSFGTATVFQGCGTASAAIDCPIDEDYYSFSPSSDGLYTITLQVAFNALVELYDSGHNLLDQENYQISRDLDGASGPYYVVVISPLDITGTYDLTISGCDAGGCGGDGDGDDIGSATMLADCGSRSAAFDCTGDVDYFEFVGTTSGQYTFETTGAMDTKMWLQDAQGADLAFDDDSGQGQNASISYTLQSGLSYFVRLEEYNNDDTGSYGLTVAGCNAAGCGSDIEGDTISAAVSLSTCGVTGAEFDCDTDVDVFRFEAPLSVSYTFETLGSRDTLMRLLDGNGNELATDDDSGTGTNAAFSRDMTAGEAVYLEVTEHFGDLGAYQVSIDGCTATGDPPTEFFYIVTAVAKVEGSEGTNWVSDLAILNVGDSSAGITISRWQRDRANTYPQEESRTLGSGQLDRTTDVLANMFGQSQGAAALQIRSDQPLIIGSRTYNTVKQKTYGQFIPGVPQHDAIASGDEVILAGLAEDGAFRTNLGLVNPGSSEIHVTATFFDAGAHELGTKTWAIPAQGYIQRNRVLREVTSNEIDTVWARLTADSGEFFSFLSIVDQQSGDPVYRPGRTSTLLAGDMLIPGVAKLEGAAGTNWVTDATFTNTTADNASVKIALWVRDGDNSNPSQRSFMLKPNRTAEVSDVLLSLFGENAGAAALQVALEPGILADGRTYNQVKEGTYGQYIPGLGEGMAVTAHRKGFLVMPVQNDGFRANLGLVNPLTKPVDVEVRMFDAAGDQIGSARSWSLAARDVKQIDRIVRRFTSQNIDAGWLELSVKSSTPDGQVHVFNSVVDQVSGDPIFETITLGP